VWEIREYHHDDQSGMVYREGEEGDGGTKQIVFDIDMNWFIRELVAGLWLRIGIYANDCISHDDTAKYRE